MDTLEKSEHFYFMPEFDLFYKECNYIAQFQKSTSILKSASVDLLSKND